jgi:hypothetical protein
MCPMTANPDHPLALHDLRFDLVDGRTRPDFMLVGGAKCGSTSFARYLPAHPQVKLPVPPGWPPSVRKEPNFWSWLRFPDRYQDLFVNESPVSRPGPGQYISGEFSTSYLVHSLAPRRICTNLPGLRIFILLRNPVDRAYSHFMMARNAGLEKECAFEEIVRREMDEAPELLAVHERGFLGSGSGSNAWCAQADGSPIGVARHERGWPERKLRFDRDLKDFYFRSYVFRSLYHDQVHRWLRLFPREQLMIIQSERFFADPAGTMNEAAEFLGLEPFDFRPAEQLQRRWDAGADNAHEMPRAYAPMDDGTRELLSEFFEPYNQRLYRLVGEDFGWD